MKDTTPSRDLTRTSFALLCIGGLLAASFWTLQPFLAPLIWATLLVIAGWPMLCKVQRALGNRRGPAVAVIMSLLLLVFIVPFALLFEVLVAEAPGAMQWLRDKVQHGLPGPPDWVQNVPLFGKRLASGWADLAASDPEALRSRIVPHLDQLAGWFAVQAANAGLLMLHFAMTLALAALLFARGEQFGSGIRRFAHRLDGERGSRTVLLAAQSVRAVAVGVVVTALVQTAVGGLGLAVAGIPAAGLLTAVIFLASIAQIGAAVVLALAAVWLFATGEVGWGITMVVWTVVTGSLDNFIRPMLIRKGVDLPLVLVFAGVIGGLIAFGPVGLFAGPVVLTVSHTLLVAWIGEDEPTEVATTGNAT